MPAKLSHYDAPEVRDGWTVDGVRIQRGGDGQLWKWDGGQVVVAPSDRAADWLIEHGAQLGKHEEHVLRSFRPAYIKSKGRQFQVAEHRQGAGLLAYWLTRRFWP